MELTTKQLEGLKITIDRYKNKEKYTVISGYAGTGKSTLVSAIIDAIQIDPKLVAYAAYTGKAAEVLRAKGNPNACTLHKLLYDHIPQKDGTFLRKEKQRLDYKIVVVDEVSMVPLSMVKRLLAHSVYVIFLGDPFQLPQIDKDDVNHLLDSPHIFLDEIMRQAAESEIIQLTMKIRAGEPIPYKKGNDVMVIPKSQLSDGMLTWADQILVATNSTREQMNNKMRELKGYSGWPQDGERIICLRNYWDDCNVNGGALVNGTTGIIQNPFPTYRYIPTWVKTSVHAMPVIQGNFISDDGEEFKSIELDRQMIMGGSKCIDYKTAYILNKNKFKWGDIIPREFNFAYVLTYWKSQGSEWERVLVIEEKFPFDKLEHKRAIYTACTRASDKLILVKSI